jgi:NADH:ubiquinone reductase (non-electrogenic)
VISGVEFAAELRDFVKEDLNKQYPGLAEHARITLVHSRDHILNNYDEQVEAVNVLHERYFNSQ